MNVFKIRASIHSLILSRLSSLEMDDNNLDDTPTTEKSTCATSVDEQSSLMDHTSETSSINSNHQFNYNICCDDCECLHSSGHFGSSKASTNKASNDVVLYKNFKHCEKAFELLNDLRKDKMLCDLTLVVKDHEIYCHKTMLIACSPYFHAMFTSSLQESASNRIVMKKVDAHTLQVLVDYMYTGSIEINLDNVQSILVVSNLLQLDNVKESCSQLILSQLHVTNCLGILMFADMYSCSELLKQANVFIEQYFGDVCKTEEFMSLSKDQLIRILKDDNLIVDSEVVVFEAAMSWITNNPSAREKHLEVIMEHIRWPLLGSDYLKTILENPLLKQNVKCRDFIIEALLEIIENQKNIHETTFKSRFKPREASGLPKLLLLIGGQAPKAESTVDAYDFRSQAWIKRADLLNPRCRAGSVYLNDLVYVLGGFNGNCRVRTVDIYNTKKDLWTSGQDMLYRRSTLNACVLKNKIYAVGGFDGNTGLSSAECYDSTSNTWHMIASMSTSRSSVGVCALDGYLYAIGGYSGLLSECLNSVERYDPTKDQWTLVASMQKRRSGVAVLTHENKIYAIGGHNGPAIKRSAEMYDPIEDKWVLIADMNSGRRNSSAVVYNGQIYVIGGDDGQNNLCSAEIYNIKLNSWSCLSRFLSVPRTYFCAVVVDKNVNKQKEHKLG